MSAKRVIPHIILGISLVGFMLGCGKKSKSLLEVDLDVVGAAPATVITPEPQGKTGWTNIKGRVVYAGNPLPVQNPLVVNKDQAHCLEKGPILSEDLVVNPKNNGVRYTFVWLAPKEKDGKIPIHPDLQAVPKTPAVIDQPCCAFVPRALGMREGQDLIAKNPAPVTHNFHWTGHPLKNAGGNVIMPAGKDYTVKGLQADRFPIKLNCDIHPWMSGWVRVFDHPYFAVTDADGNFEIKQAPAGEFMLVTWHEAKGWLVREAGKDPGQPLTVKGEVLPIPDIQYSP